MLPRAGLGTVPDFPEANRFERRPDGLRRWHAMGDSIEVWARRRAARHPRCSEPDAGRGADCGDCGAAAPLGRQAKNPRAGPTLSISEPLWQKSDAFPAGESPLGASSSFVLRCCLIYRQPCVFPNGPARIRTSTPRGWQLRRVAEAIDQVLRTAFGLSRRGPTRTKTRRCR